MKTASRFKPRARRLYRSGSVSLLTGAADIAVRNGEAPLRKRCSLKRRGVSTMDYVLVLAVIFPLAAALMTIVPRIIRLVYEMTIVQLGSPLM